MTYESSKRGEGNSYQKDKEEKKKVCNSITVKNRVTWPRIIGTRKGRMKEQTLHAKIQMIMKIWWL